MSKIRILPDILSNKIAAGEVVERPASVVKELVENALDAGGTRLLIDIEQGGTRMIRVADNGCGMGRDDALLAIERYATSKIYTDEDLFAIRTLGFRGEALPSIASVSRLSLLTRDADSEAGVEITLEGGKLMNVAERGSPRGTMATVAQLFFNTPARRKFLKSIGTEMGHVTDAVAGIALGRPEVHFHLTHNGKAVKNWPAVADPFERALDVLGAGLRGELHAVGFSSGEVTVGGWVSSPRYHRKTSGGIFIFVNGRLVRDRMVQHALFQAYAQRLVKGQFPSAVLFITVPFDQVDVNVHPTKTEVRFARSDAVHEAVRRAAAQTLYDVDRPQWGPAGGGEGSLEGGVGEASSEFGRRKAESGVGNSEGGMRKAEWREENRGGTPLPQERVEGGSGDRGEHAEAAPGLRSLSNFGGAGSSRDITVATSSPGFSLNDSPTQPAGNGRLRQTEIWEKTGFSGLRVIGQLRDTYIICEGREGLILIDQHAAHERVVYDQLTRSAESGRRAVQVLLVPETVDLGFREARALEQMIPFLKELGIEIEPFGGNTVIVKSVPGILSGRPVQPFITEIAEAAAGGSLRPDEALDRCRQLAACHGAIRANQRLALEQIQHLLRQLDECANLSHCPHGRPTWLRFDIAGIERGFRRVV